eukprot:1972965-Amphidinium_carterae.1
MLLDEQTVSSPSLGLCASLFLCLLAIPDHHGRLLELCNETVPTDTEACEMDKTVKVDATKWQYLNELSVLSLPR